MKHICLLILLFNCFLGNCFADDWTVNTVAYNMTGLSSVAVDINNNPIVSFTTIPYPAYSALYAVTQTDSGYDVNQIRTGAAWPKIIVNSNNELTIAFQTLGGNVWYGTKSSWFDWFFSQVASTAPVACPDIALTSNDIPHLAYIGGSGYVEHAFYNIQTQQWVKETLTGFGNYSIGNLDIDIDSSGRILIGCHDRGGTLRCAVSTNGSWYYLPVMQTSDADSGFAAGDLPAVAYIKSEMLYYAVYISEIGWVETQIGIARTTGHKRYSLAHSSTGIPGIAYSDNGILMYATNIAGGWTTVPVDQYGKYIDLIFDRSDNPLISYAGFDDCLAVPVIKLAGIGLESFNIADLNNDKIVNFSDFAIMAEYWMMTLPAPDRALGDLTENAVVDVRDLRYFGCYWLN